MIAIAAVAVDSFTAATEILTVTALARSVRDLLEHRFSSAWVTGEISNFKPVSSGHYYFVLKDAGAQVRCVMFRHRNQYLDWQPRDGMQVELRAAVTLYEPRGDFQLNVETMRRAGQGSLHEAFLKLRDRLAAQGLFDEINKRRPPALPRRIGVVSSLGAAALRDILTTLARRNPSIPVIIYPSAVQGANASAELIAAIERAGRRAECDVLLLARGGGSIEDLWAFNDESLAHAIRACPIAIIAGIGHQTDFTIADFAADVRAATPTAAAEMVSPLRTALLLRTRELVERLGAQVRRSLEQRMQRVDGLARRLVHPKERVQARRQHLGQLVLRLTRASSVQLERARRRLEPLRVTPPMRADLDRRGTRLAALRSALDHLDPRAVLDRGYSLVTDEQGRVITSASQVRTGVTVHIDLARGRIDASVTAVTDDKA